MTTKEAANTYDKPAESADIKEPNLYKVIIYNDDFTTQDFVVEILVRVFQKPPREAVEIMWQVHSEGSGIAGIFSYDIAASRVRKAHQLARSADYPLHLQYEPV